MQHQRLLLGTVLLTLAACGQGREPNHQAQSDSASTPARAATIEGFQTPESVMWAPGEGVWYVSNINGNPSAKDNNGFISVLNRAGQVDSLKYIEGGRGGITLNAPKGMALIGDTLWVADIDALRGFNRRSAAAVASIPLPGAQFLNDVVAGPGDTLYVTDTGIEFDSLGQMSHPGPDRIYAIAPDHSVRVAVEGDSLGGPNGIAWDAGQDRFLVVQLTGSRILSWTPGQAPTVLASGPGTFDGVALEKNGRILVSSWADSTVDVVDSGRVVPLIHGVASPADIGLDRETGLLGVPIFTGNTVEFWRVP